MDDEPQYLILESVADWSEKPCPSCGAPTMDNGLIFWCDQGHVYSYDAGAPGFLLVTA